MLSALRVELKSGLPSVDLDLANVKRTADAFARRWKLCWRTSARGNNTSKSCFWARQGNEFGECYKVKVSRSFLMLPSSPLPPPPGTRIPTLRDPREKGGREKKKRRRNPGRIEPDIKKGNPKEVTF